jgi:hypothetical protein
VAGGIVFEVDTRQISRLSEATARLIGQYEWITARAMTEAAKAAKEQIAREILPKIQGGPTAWTRRGLIVKYARRDDLRAMAGFQYGGGRWEDSEFDRKAGGIPAGRYMGINARGGDRRAKASERQLRRAGVIRQDQFIVPNGKVLRLNAQGNLPAGQYTQILSRLRALEQGSAPAGPGSRGRSGAARSNVDYFGLRYSGGRPARWELGADPIAIARRVGAKPKGGTGKGSGQRGRPQTVGYRRGFAPALWVTDQPNYERRFDIRGAARRGFDRTFAQAWEAGLTAELRRAASRR